MFKSRSMNVIKIKIAYFFVKFAIFEVKISVVEKVRQDEEKALFFLLETSRRSKISFLNFDR